MHHNLLERPRVGAGVPKVGIDGVGSGAVGPRVGSGGAKGWRWWGQGMALGGPGLPVRGTAV